MGNATTRLEFHQGNIECGNFDIQVAYFADHLSCFLFQFPYKLDTTKFAYLSTVFLFIIIAISIFGNIKENYRWFILNSSIFDLFCCYEFICVPHSWSLSMSIQERCYFGAKLSDFLREGKFIDSFPSLGLFLITGSRFLSLYYPKSFKHWKNKTWKVILGIIFFDILYFSVLLLNIFWSSNYEFLPCTAVDSFEEYSKHPKVFEFEDIKCGKNSNDPLLCYYMIQASELPCDIEHRFLKIIDNLYLFVVKMISPFLLLLTTIFIISIISKLIRQFKFLALTNMEMLKINIRLVIVLSIQTIFLLYIASMRLVLFISEFKEGGKFKDFPFWFTWAHDERTIRGYQQLRIFIDAFVILIVMTGYRENFAQFCLCIFGIFKNPKKTFKNVVLKARKLSLSKFA